jgi:hypothetical protein
MRNALKHIGKIAPYLVLIGLIGTGLEYLRRSFTSLEAHERLISRVDTNETRLLYKEALDEYYFYRKQVRKYPEDREIKAKMLEAERRVKILEGQLYGK